MLGLYVLPKIYAMDGTQLSDQAFEEAWTSLQKSEKIVYDQRARMVFVRNFLRFNPITGVKQVKGAIRRLADLPRTHLFNELYGVCSSLFAGDEDAVSLLYALENRKNEFEK